MADEVTSSTRAASSADVLQTTLSNQMRLEALKLAYEVAFKLNHFNYPLHFNDKKLEDQQKDYNDVIRLAGIHHDYIRLGKIDIA